MKMKNEEMYELSENDERPLQRTILTFSHWKDVNERVIWHPDEQINVGALEFRGQNYTLTFDSEGLNVHIVGIAQHWLLGSLLKFLRKELCCSQVGEIAFC